MTKHFILGAYTMRALFLFAIAMFSFATPAQAWWDQNWKFRKAVVVDTTPTGVNVSGAIGRTVVLVKLTSANFTFTEALDNGADVRVIDTDDKTALSFHIERYDAKTGIAYVWVSVPAMNGGEKRQLWLYFGNGTAPAGSDVKGTFDPDYLAVYHFDENPGQSPGDKTANANNALNAPPGVNDGAIIGRGARFPGQGALQVAASPSLAMPAGAPLTISSWVKPDQLGGEQSIFARGALVVGMSDGAPFIALGGARTQATTALKQSEWSHLAVVADGQTLKLYVNGIESAAASVALPALDGPISIGGADGRAFTGELDEFRLSKVARPAAMILAMANAEGPSAKLVAVSESAEQQSHGSGVIPFIIGKLEPLDQGIVVLCLLLLAGAMGVMISKIRYLNAAQRGNDVFMKRFRDMHEELVPVREVPGITPEEVVYIEKAPLGHLYETGIEELQVRRRRASTRPLSGEAVEAMRAAVDAEVVAENQKMDKWMVLLTIAISGGPFIGLLGTVIGVMSTFGGVAMAGDVNVNAIAPGIAAALLATIAGLAAAIPSLFGYNYLNGRISAMADEMRVFVDRLITRLAEIQADAATPSPLLMAAE
jgi:biopolymer transport protein ExbB